MKLAYLGLVSVIAITTGLLLPIWLPKERVLSQVIVWSGIVLGAFVLPQLRKQRLEKQKKENS